MNRRLLALIGRRFPAVYDVIPRGPQGLLSRVALNPQPLPPHELGAALANEFVHAAWTAERLGLDPALAMQDLDDWCPTRPRKLKLPPWWPPPPDPDPHPDWFAAFHLGFAARLAVATDGLTGTKMAAVLDQALERSVSALEGAIG